MQNQVVLLAASRLDPASTGRALSTAAAARLATLFAWVSECLRWQNKNSIFARVKKNQHPTVGLLMCCDRAKEALRLTHVCRNGVEHVVPSYTHTVCCESQLHRRLNNTASVTRCAPMITDIPSWKGAESAIASESVSSDFSLSHRKIIR